MSEHETRNDEAMLVTDLCRCGHQIIAHSATDGCVYCDCDERYRDLPQRAATPPRNSPTRDVREPHRWRIRERRFWWTAYDPDEPVAMFDGYTYYRARTKERLLTKLARLSAPRPSPWGSVDV
jgi:hypothetical protein